MKVNFNTCFTDAYGNALANGNIAEKLGQILFNASTLHGTPLNGDQKYMAYMLCRKITGSKDTAELTVEEASFLKELSAEQLSAGAYGQVFDMIENS